MSSSTHHFKVASGCDGAKSPPKCAIIPPSNCIGGQERDREGKESSYTRPTIADRDRTVGMRRAQAAVRHCDTTASLKPETGKKNAAETQEKSVETETESRGRVPSKCQALYKSALMEELCFQESTECSPAKCTWLALHTQTRAHVLMRGWRRSRAGPLHEV